MKYEIRSTKSETNPKFECPKHRTHFAHALETAKRAVRHLGEQRLAGMFLGIAEGVEQQRIVIGEVGRGADEAGGVFAAERLGCFQGRVGGASGCGEQQTDDDGGIANWMPGDWFSVWGSKDRAFHRSRPAETNASPPAGRGCWARKRD
ncbi:MAG: hypothetical protein MUF25_26715 [Pirellulaceae bacterium]|nr:hypothetical protein [Pirellulaceae bacterium]